MDTPASRLSWVATTAKQAIDDIHELADLPFAASSLVVFANLALVFAGGRGADHQVVKAYRQILSGLVREFSSQALHLHPSSTKGRSPMPTLQRHTSAVRQASHMAAVAIDQIRDLESFSHAGRSLVYLAELLVQTPHEDLVAARDEDPEAPGLTTLFERWKKAGIGLSMAAAS